MVDKIDDYNYLKKKIPSESKHNIETKLLLGRLTELVNKAPVGFERYKILTTFCQVLNSDILYDLLRKGDKNTAMSYLERYSNKYPVPDFYRILSTLGFKIQVNDREIALLKPRKVDRPQEVYIIKDDEMSSGLESLRLATIVLASENDDKEYKLPYDKNHRRVVMEADAKKRGIPFDYEEYISGDIKRISGDYVPIDPMNDEGEIDISDVEGNFSVGFVTPDDVVSLARQGVARRLAFKCKLRRGTEEPQVEGYNLSREGVDCTYSPKIIDYYVKGPEHQDHVEAIIAFIKRNMETKDGAYFNPNPDRLEERIKQGKNKVLIPPDFKRQTPQNASSTPQIKDKSVLKKYAHVRNDYETCRPNLQKNYKEVYQHLVMDVELPKSWKKYQTATKKNLGGKTFDQMLAMTLESLNSYLEGVYKIAICGTRKEDYSLKNLDWKYSYILDSLIKSPGQYPEMINNGYGYVFKSSWEAEPPFNPAKDPLHNSIKHGIIEDPTTFDEPDDSIHNAEEVYGHEGTEETEFESEEI